MAKRSLLVTGGAGFIGSNFIRYWLQNNPDDTVINLDALTYAGNPHNLKEFASDQRYVFVEGSINDLNLVNKIMADVEYVVHFAAETHVDRSILEPNIFLETNVLGTHTLLHSALKHNIKRFHHISTDEVFGSLELGSRDQFNESTAYDPRSPYSASKAASDHIVRAYGETYGLPFTISNCSNNYGEFHHPEKFFPLAITNIIENKKIPLYGDGLNVRDWLYVQDHCTAIARILEDGKDGQTYLIGGLTEDISNSDVLRLIIRLMHAPEDSIEFVRDRAGHDRRYAVDWSKINKELGWKPSVTLEEGLLRTITWYQEHTDWWQPLKQQSQDFFAKNYKTA